MLVELKYNQSNDGAVAQILKRNYPQVVSEFSGEMLLVGINYDKKTKKHSCKIERYCKENPPSTHHQPTINPSSTHHQPIINPPSTHHQPIIHPNVAKLLSVMDNGMYSTADLMRLLNLRDRVSFSRNYLNLAIESGYVRMLYPNNPRRKGQKYYIQER